ncbi:MAG: hypothetical protein IJG02_08205, partial [Thermoguttaceae bacterium]|nr:hypothetical protein [Thermoguttaceae bacterium]
MHADARRQAAGTIGEDPQKKGKEEQRNRIGHHVGKKAVQADLHEAEGRQEKEKRPGAGQEASADKAKIEVRTKENIRAAAAQGT